MEKTQSVTINNGLHRKLKIVSAIRGIKVKDAVEQAITNWVKINEQKPGRGINALVGEVEPETAEVAE